MFSWGQMRMPLGHDGRPRWKNRAPMERHEVCRAKLGGIAVTDESSDSGRVGWWSPWSNPVGHNLAPSTRSEQCVW